MGINLKAKQEIHLVQRALIDGIHIFIVVLYTENGWFIYIQQKKCEAECGLFLPFWQSFDLIWISCEWKIYDPNIYKQISAFFLWEMKKFRDLTFSFCFYLYSSCFFNQQKSSSCLIPVCAFVTNYLDFFPLCLRPLRSTFRIWFTIFIRLILRTQKKIKARERKKINSNAKREFVTQKLHCHWTARCETQSINVYFAWIDCLIDRSVIQKWS